MKFRNVLMTAAFLLAVSSTFAIKAKTNNWPYFQYTLAGTCHIGSGTDPNCSELNTGTQCTYIGQPMYYQHLLDVPPTCTIPLRRPL